MSESLARQLPSAGITPFWRRIPRFFLYPVAPLPLLLMLLLSLASVAPLLVPGVEVTFVMSPLALGLWLFLLWVPFLRYAYSVLERTAYGIVSARERYDTRYGQYRPWKQVLILALALALVGVVGSFAGRLLGLLLFYALLLVLPANIMWLARSDSLAGSLNPLALAHLIRAIGWPYLGLCGLLMALTSASNALALALLAVLAPSPWVYPAVCFASMYFTLVMYHVMGYVMYQYHAPLGLHPLRLPAATFGERSRAWLRDPGALDAHLQQLAADGQVDDAVALLAGLIRREPEDLKLHERYNGALRQAGDKDKWQRHSSEYLGLLLREGQSATALALYDRCRRALPEFQPNQAATQVELARAARAHGDSELASSLLMDFDHRFPGSLAQPEAYYLAAQLLHEDFGETAEARTLLAYLVRTFPGHPLGIAAQRYVQLLDKR
jgi:hypothetical protein